VPVDHRREGPFAGRNDEIRRDHAAVRPNRGSAIGYRSGIGDIKNLYSIAFLDAGLLKVQGSVLVVVPVAKELIV
jgi:hypothetical protein